MGKPWKRYRFHVDAADCRPVKFPPPGPWWRSGFNSNENAILVAFLPSESDLLEFWPDAFLIEFDEVDGITFTDRFPEPDWWKEKQAADARDKPASKGRQVRMNLTLNEEANRLLDRLAEDLGTTRSEVLRKSLALMRFAVDAKARGQKVGAANPDQEIATEVVGI